MLFHLSHNTRLYGLTCVIPPFPFPYPVFVIWYDREAFAETTGVCQSGRRTEEEEQHKRLRVYRRKCNTQQNWQPKSNIRAVFPPILVLAASLDWHRVLAISNKKSARPIEKLRLFSCPQPEAGIMVC